MAGELSNFLALADAQIARRVEAGALLHESMDDLEAQCFGEFAQFGQRGLEFAVADIRQVDGRHDGVQGLFFCAFATWLFLMDKGR